MIPELKRRLDAAAKETGRSQSQEAEVRLASTFEREDMLDQVFGKAVQAALALLEVKRQSQTESWLRGSVHTKGDLTDDTYVFILEGDDDAVARPASPNISEYDQETQKSSTVTLAEYHRLARKNRLRLVSTAKAAAAATDTAMHLIKCGRKTLSCEQLLEAIRKDLMAK